MVAKLVVLLFVTGNDEKGDKVERAGHCLFPLLCGMQQFKRPNWQVFSTDK
jgi:hypothetical protein